MLSTVDGARITQREVVRLAQRGGLSASSALSKLQAERLLEREAERRGYAQTSQTQFTARQALVQALLARDVEAEPVTEAEIEAAYRRDAHRFSTPEKREATHVLAYLRPKAGEVEERAAHAFAQAACRKLLASSDLKATLSEISQQTPEQVTVRVEGLPAVAHEGKFVPEFEQALFSIPKPGVVPEPVRTQFGWHVIVLTEITPASVVPLTAARAELSRELTIDKRKQRLAQLLVTLQARTKVEYAKLEQTALSTLEF